MDDLKCRVGLAKLLDGGFGDLGSTEVDFLQGGECAEGGDCLIGDGGIVQVEVLEFFEFGDLLELGVGNIGAVEVEALELFKSVKGVEKLVGQVEVGAVDPDEFGAELTKGFDGFFKLSGVDDGEVDTDGIVAPSVVLGFYSGGTDGGKVFICAGVAVFFKCIGCGAYLCIGRPVGAGENPCAYGFQVGCGDRVFFYWGHGLVVFTGQFHAQDDMAFFGVAGEDGLDLAFTGGEEGFFCIETVAAFLFGGAVAGDTVALKDGVCCVEECNAIRGLAVCKMRALVSDNGTLG